MYQVRASVIVPAACPDAGFTAHYAGLREVPVSVSSKYSAAPPTGIPRDFRPVGEDILDAVGDSARLGQPESRRIVKLRLTRRASASSLAI